MHAALRGRHFDALLQMQVALRSICWPGPPGRPPHRLRPRPREGPARPGDQRTHPGAHRRARAGCDRQLLRTAGAETDPGALGHPGSRRGAYLGRRAAARQYAGLPARAAPGVRSPSVPGHIRGGRLAERDLRLPVVLLRARRTWPGRCGATSRTRSPCCWPRCGRCSCCSRWCCSAAADRARRRVLAAAAIALVGLLIVVSAFDRSFFEVRNFLILVPLVLLLIARLVTGWIRKPEGPIAGRRRRRR